MNQWYFSLDLCIKCAKVIANNVFPIRSKHDNTLTSRHVTHKKLSNLEETCLSRMLGIEICPNLSSHRSFYLLRGQRYWFVFLWKQWLFGGTIVEMWFAFYNPWHQSRPSNQRLWVTSYQNRWEHNFHTGESLHWDIWDDHNSHFNRNCSSQHAIISIISFDYSGWFATVCLAFNRNSGSIVDWLTI